jgi:urease accessory protein
VTTATECRPERPVARPAVTEIVVAPGPEHGHPAVSVRSGLLAPRLLGTSAGLARVALVATTATLLGGDAMELHVHVGDGMRLELEDVSATVAYDGRGRPAHWGASVSVGVGATLVWRGEPLVASEGADVTRSLRLTVSRGGRALLRDLLVLGRHGEQGGSVRSETRVTYAGAPLLLEQLDLSPGRRSEPGTLGEHRVIDTVTCVGEGLPRYTAPEDSGAVQLDLAGPGVVVRRLGPHTHGSPLDRVWRELGESMA